MSSHKPIKIYMGGLILGVNTLYRLFCFFKLFPMVGKELSLFTFPALDQNDEKQTCGCYSCTLDIAWVVSFGSKSYILDHFHLQSFPSWLIGQ